MDNTVKTGEEKPDFVKVNHGATDVWEKYVVPLIKENNKLRSRIKELESENEELRKTIKALIPMAEDGQALRRRNNILVECLTEGDEQIRRARSLLATSPI